MKIGIIQQACTADTDENKKKLAQNIVNRDTSIKFTKLGRQAACVGDCMLSRSKLLGVL